MSAFPQFVFYLISICRSVLEKSLQAMMECMDTVSQETNKLINHQRQVIKQQQAKNQYLQKRVRTLSFYFYN